MNLLKTPRLGLAVAAAVAGIMTLASPAVRADITFQTGNHPGPNEENILFGTSESGSSINGFTNQTNVGVEFNTLTGQTLFQNAQGQADIFCSANCINGGGNHTTQLNSMEIKLQSGFGATDFIGNLDFGEGTAQVKVTDQAGAVFTYILGNGQNFFTLDAINNEVITDIQITVAPGSTTPFGWDDFKQPRISGVCTLSANGTCTPSIPTPEPATLALLGSALVGLGCIRRRRRHNSV